MGVYVPGSLLPYDFGLGGPALDGTWNRQKIERPFHVDTTRNDAHPNVALPFLLPGFVLSLRALTDYNVLYSSAVVWFSVGFGALLVLAARAGDSAARKMETTIAFFVVCLGYGYGISVEANTLLDRSPGTKLHCEG